MQYHTLFVGIDGDRVVSADETRRQIWAIRGLACRLVNDGKPVTWLDVDNPDEPRTIFHAIVKDREIRVDKKTLMADRPAFAVVTVRFPDPPGGPGEAIRLEYYEGHDALSLVFDVRAPELQGKDLPRFLDTDPLAYDPVKFLKDVFGLPEEFTRPILEAPHQPPLEKLVPLCQAHNQHVHKPKDFPPRPSQN